MQTAVLISFFAYFLILLAIGVISHKKQTSSADFIVGNRSLNFWLTALTAQASDMSAWLFMSMPAAIFIGGLADSWIAAGLVLGMFSTWQFIAQRLREETEKYNSYTLSTYFERRFNDHTGIIRVLTATWSVIFLTVYLASGLMAIGNLFESLFGINYYLGLTVATIIVVTYTFMGGFVTVAWTDFFQGVFLLFVIMGVGFVGMQAVGGWDNMLQSATDYGMSFQVLPDSTWEAYLAILFSFFWGLGYFGQPHIVTKFMGIKNPNEIHKSKYLGMSWQILALGSAIMIGVVGFVFFKGNMQNPELVFIEMVKQLFNPYLAGFILCAVLAANISTMDSQILVCASVLGEDFFKHFMKKDVSQETLLKASRYAVILVAACSLGIAFMKSSTIMVMVKYAWDGLGCAFGPLMLMSLYSKKTTVYGAIAGIFVGGLIASTWPVLNPYVTSLPITPMLPGFFLSLASIFVVSRVFNGSRVTDISRPT